MTEASSRQRKGTNVRANFRRKVAIARGTVGALGLVAPPLAAQLALRLFTSTQRSTPREGERDVLSSARRFVVPFRDERLIAWETGRGPTVVLAHGWNGRATQLAPFVAPLRDAGFRAVLFDQVAHGNSTGSSATIRDFADGIAAVADYLGGVHAVVAHSMGGAATTIALSHGLALERAVFIAPPLDPSLWIERFSKMLDLKEGVEKRFLAKLEQRVGHAPEELNGATIAPRLAVPLLLFHDVEDREVPASASATLADAWPGAQRIETTGLGHQRILADENVISEAVRFLTAPLLNDITNDAAAQR